MWVRGLKPVMPNQLITLIKSHPMWVRGLKPPCKHQYALIFRRTPCGCVD